MRGTRVDRTKNNRLRIVHFGRFETSVPSEELDMSEKDAVNLTHQLLEHLPNIWQDIFDEGWRSRDDEEPQEDTP